MEKTFSLIRYTKSTGYTLLISGVILLNLKESTSLIPLWTFVSLPFIFVVALLPLAIHLLALSSLFNLKPRLVRFLLFCGYSISVGLAYSLITGAMNLDEIISMSWPLVFLGIWYALIVYGVFCVFLIPGLFSKQVRMKRQGYALIFYFVGGLVFSILLVVHLEDPQEVYVVVLLQC